MHDHFYNFVRLNLEDEALVMAKILKMEPGIGGVAGCWKFNHDCQALRGQRVQALANAFRLHPRVQKCARAVEQW